MSLLRAHLPIPTAWCDDHGQPTPEHFAADLRVEHTALRDGAALCDLTHQGILTLEGPERLTFLGGLTTNQVNDISANRTIHTTLLSPQGRFLWDFTLVALDARLCLLTEPDRVPQLVERLLMYRLRSKVTIAQATGTLGTLAIAGPQAGSVLARLFPGLDPEAPLGTTIAPTPTQRLWRDPRHAACGFRLLAPATELPGLWDRLAAHATPVGLLAWEGHRIRHALPRGGVDFLPDQTLPLEAGGKELNMVSFTKGCYVGQETTARTHGRGTIKKRLHLLQIATTGDIPPGTPVLTATGKEAGVVTSFAHLEEASLALALLRRADVIDHPDLTVAGLPATAHRPPWAAWE
ncbi:MAG: folate-binding protein YgfZ [Magnetococcales bacterium]|nr:folate-binding protein YgfZ [Magnetococcales bacterium]